MIAGLEEVSAGRIHIDGRDVADVAPAERDIAMVFQNYALYPHMSVRENMAFGLRMRKLPEHEINQRVSDAAEILSVESLLERRPRELSGGQRQRVALGRAIVRQPKVFLFDEPLSNLDAKLRVQMRTELARLHVQLGTTMIYVTHDQVEAMTLGDRIVVLHKGIIQQVDAPMALYQRPANRFVAGFIGSPAMTFLPGELTGQGFRPADSDVVLPLGVGAPARPAVLGLRPEGLDLDPSLPSMGDVTLDVVERMGHETLAYFRLHGQACVARLAPEAPLATGQRVTLGLKPDGWHLFAAEGEQRRLSGTQV
jgi:ABC-type sugar transport system ATPase subunit